MKKFLVVAILALLGVAAVAQDSNPFGPDLYNIVKRVDPKLDGQDGDKVLKVARATYDISEHGGGTGAHGLGVYLPAKAVLVQSWFHVLTQFVDGGAGTVALSCEDANNIYSAADITGNGPGVIVKGAQTGGTDSMGTGIADRCELTATVATAAQTAGKLVLFVKYLVLE